MARARRGTGAAAYRWPPLYDVDRLAAIGVVADAAARTRAERSRFPAALASVRDASSRLGDLYAQLPAVLAGDAAARNAFAATLDRAARQLPLRDLAPPPAEPVSPRRLGRTGHVFAVAPARVFAVGVGIDALGGTDRTHRRRFQALDALWRWSPLEQVYRLAFDEAPRARRGLRTLLTDVAERPRGLPFPEWPSLVPGALEWPPAGSRADLCRQLALRVPPPIRMGGGLLRVPGRSLQTTTTDANGIIAVPEFACPGGHLVISGTFPASQPVDVDVVIGALAVTVVSWSSTRIKVLVPADARDGCVGFRSKAADAARRDAWEALTETTATAADAVGCASPREEWMLPYVPEAAPCTGANAVHVGLPIVDSFLVNGAASAKVGHGDFIKLSWKTRFATHVSLRRYGNLPGVDVNPKPSNGAKTVGAWEGELPRQGTYQLTAWNDCGGATAEVSVEITETPALAITAIEAVQSIQTPGNTVRLVEGKPTLVRVFVDSGITEGWDFGAGPNAMPGVRGTLTVTEPGGPQTVLLAPASVVAVPGGGSRVLSSGSLLFDLPPSLLSGKPKLVANVWVEGHESETDPGWRASSTTTSLTFQPTGTQRIRPIVVTNVGMTPTQVQIDAAVQGALDRLPLAAGAITLAPSDTATVGQGEDPTTLDGWAALAARLWASSLATGGTGLRVAFLPPGPSYAFGSVSLPGFILCIAGSATSFAEALCRSAGFGPAPCPPGLGADMRLPAATEDVAFDSSMRTFLPAGTPELTCLATGSWPSIALYDLMFSAFPIS